jgi:hypothetical protein
VTWLTVALVYCVVCWLIGLFGIRVLVRARGEETEGPPPPVAQLFVAMILFMPILCPFVVFSTVLCLGRSLGTLRYLWTLHRVSRSVREYEFIPVDVGNLDEAVREHFESVTPCLVRLGFEPVGDFRLKPKPVEVHDRLLFDTSGETLAAACALLDTGAVSFISVLEDGTCVHTSSVADPHPERTSEPADQLCITYLPDTSVAALYGQHRDTVRDQAARRGTRVIGFRRDQFREVLVYDQRVFNRWRFRHGSLDQEPPAPDLATLLAPAIEPAGKPAGSME